MSWSASAVGKPQAVAASLAKQFSANPCAEPEETVRQAVATAVAAAVAAQDPSSVVKVVASGSQSFKDYNAKTGVQNALNVVIEPLYGFVE